LTAKAAAIAKTLTSDKEKDDFVFVNKRGNPWNRHSVGNCMARLKKKIKKRFSLYDFRHGFATRMLEAGLDHLTVAKLLGHQDTSMLGRVYSHIGEKNDYLLTQLRKVG